MGYARTRGIGGVCPRLDHGVGDAERIGGNDTRSVDDGVHHHVGEADLGQHHHERDDEGRNE